MYDVEALKTSVDLLAYVQADLGMEGKRRGKGRTFPCPMHGDSAGDGGSLYVTTDPPIWKCFGACSETGDVIAYVRKRRGVGFHEACELLGAAVVDGPAAGRPKVDRRPMPPIVFPPPAEWQEAAAEACERARQVLWSDRGAHARAWLNRRGLTDATLEAWELGYNPTWYDTAIMRPADGGQPERPAGMPPGIVIPCRMGGNLWMVKVRQGGKDPQPKYRNLWGGEACLFGADTLKRHRVAVLCEGEFDAMLMHQECGDVAGVATTTGGSGTWFPQWNGYLLGASRILTAYDHDAAGEKANARMAAMSPRVRVLELPDGQDLTDFHHAGGNLRALLVPHLEPAPGKGERMPVEDLAPDTDADIPPPEDAPSPVPWVRVRSRILGCDVLAMKDGYTGPLPAGVPAFTRSELERMRGLDADALRTVCDTKREFGGRYVGPAPARKEAHYATR